MLFISCELFKKLIFEIEHKRLKEKLVSNLFKFFKSTIRCQSLKYENGFNTEGTWHRVGQ